MVVSVHHDGRLSIGQLLPQAAPTPDTATLIAVDSGDAGNRWPVRVQQRTSDTYVVYDGIHNPVIHVRDAGTELVLSAPAICRAGMLDRRRPLTGADVTARMDITDRKLAASIAAFANWLIGGATDAN